MDNLAPQIARIFEETRDWPGEPIPEQFLDGLLSGGLRRIDDSFRGKRRKLAFMRRIEMHFAICFTTADLERLWRFNEFVDRVTERRQAPRANRQAIAKRLQAERSADWGLLAMIAALGAGLALVAPGAFALVPTALAVALLATIGLVKIGGIRHYRALEALLDRTEATP